MTSQKIAIVTGASGNMGIAVIEKFLREGYRVVGTVIENDPVKINLTAPGLEIATVNLADETASQQFVASVIQKHGRIDIAVLTVGGFGMGNIASTSTSAILQQYTVNFETAYNIARPCFGQMLLQKTGRIFFVGSRPGLSAADGNGMTAYGLSKSLVVRLSELINAEAIGLDIVSTVIVPGTIDTLQNRKSMPEADPANWVKSTAIADVIYFYSTEEASTIRQPLIKMYNNA